MPLGGVSPLAPWNSLESSSIELERVRRGGRASLLLGGMSIWFFEAENLNSEDGSFQSGNCYNKFVSWQLSSTFLFFLFSLNNIYNYLLLEHRSECLTVVPFCSPISVTMLLALLCKHFSCFSYIFHFSLKETAQALYFYPYAASLLHAAGPFCVVILAD